MFICTGLILILFGKDDPIPMGESTAINIEDVVEQAEQSDQQEYRTAQEVSKKSP